MKRSEVIDKLSRLLYRGQGDYSNRNLAIYDANDVLNELEELGMIPPAYVKTVIEGNLYSLQTINEWEDESSENNKDHIVDSLRYAIVIDEAKDIDWDNLTHL